MLLFSVLSSGSKANCTFVSDGKTNLLIDCGLSARETTKRLNQLGINPESIAAILITHEHSDHISGISTFARKYKSTVYANTGTREAISGAFSQLPSEVTFENSAPFLVGSIIIEAFSVPHDAQDPVGFKITSEESTLVIATDIGHVTKVVESYMRDADALILESNHDLDLLMTEAPYPWELKQRIKGRKGHLSNPDAGQLVERISLHPESKLKVLIAAHVSEKSNYYELALDVLKNAWKNPECTPEFAVAGVSTATKMFTVGIETTALVNEGNIQRNLTV